MTYLHVSKYGWIHRQPTCGKADFKVDSPVPAIISSAIVVKPLNTQVMLVIAHNDIIT